ncbi:MAG: cellulase family glycosylhydrolase [Saprospiraceae bacterium]|nr:cellulase family glycosylhydrolase [Saprospiraceae bacterium]
MTAIKKKTYRRILMYTVIVILMSFTISGLSKIIAYFNSGADQYIETLTSGAIEEHSPKVEWSNTYERLDAAMQKTIERAYVQAWYVFNTSIEKRNVIAAQDYFSKGLKETLQRSMTNQEKWEINRIDLCHHLEVNLFSLDRKLISFTDKDVEIRKKIRDKGTGRIIADGIEIADFSVVMVLEDGNWRIRHFHKSAGQSMSTKASSSSPSDSSFFKCSDGKFYRGDSLFLVKGINYYPAHSPWLKFWEEFNLDTIERDFKNMADLKLNTARIFVPYGIFGKGKVSNALLNKMDQLIDLSEEYGMALIITLFDFPEGYSMRQYAATDRQLETILTRYSNRKNILAWDLKNEPDRDFENYGKETVISWLTLMAQRAREYAPRQLITIGWSKSQYALLLSEYLDFVSFHFYEDPSLLDRQIRTLKDSLVDKTIMIQETGMPSSSFLFLPGGGNEDDQAKYISEVLIVLRNNENTPYCLWALYDFSEAPSEVFGWKPWLKHVQKYYGLFRTDGSLKPSGIVISDYNN